MEQTMSELNGKIAIVTGAGQGVGYGIAMALASAGAHVVVAGRTLAKVEDTQKQIAARGGRGLAVRCDVANAKELDALVATTVAHFGGVDILVNNAYDGAWGPLLSMSDDDMMRGINAGPMASFRLMRACHPHMKARGGGHVINLVTAASERWDSSNYGAYAIAKQGVRALTRAAASEWGPDGIRVNSVAPLAMSPALEAWIKNDPDSEAYLKTVPLHRVGDCEIDIGRAVAALLKSDFSYLTGATIPLDGGQANFD
jgi:NAD(P)-dependent dehydrogenase (short-subunit alcohol dehydrogenase family)